jgi:hypothetical protein
MTGIPVKGGLLIFATTLTASASSSSSSSSSSPPTPWLPKLTYHLGDEK